jgi:hypothetical protein
MANSIALVSKYLPLLDEVYKKASLTASLDNTALSREGSEANEIKVAKTAIQGLGDYDRNTGYVNGDVTLTWETHSFSQDRGRKFGIDTMDDQESLMMAFGTLTGEFIRTRVVPEVDAYRIAQYFANANTTVEADLADGAAVISALDTAQQVMNDAEVPEEGRILMISNANYNLLKAAPSLERRIGTGNDGQFDRRFETFDGMRIVKVPTNRFYSSITQYDGATGGQEDGGYIKTAVTGRDLNFVIAHPSAIAYQGTKHLVNKVISPELNQTSDQYLFFYRLYHDVFIFDNKVAGIYAHNKTT